MSLETRGRPLTPPYKRIAFLKWYHDSRKSPELPFRGSRGIPLLFLGENQVLL
jgi:hypothetical protein